MSLLEGQEPLASVPDPPAEPETTAEAEKGTEYVVFKLETVEDLEAWRQIGIGRGTYAGVIKEIAGQVDGVYSASPTRSWRPVRLGVKTEITLSEV